MTRNIRDRGASLDADLLRQLPPIDGDDDERSDTSLHPDAQIGVVDEIAVDDDAIEGIDERGSDALDWLGEDREDTQTFDVPDGRPTAGDDGLFDAFVDSDGAILWTTDPDDAADDFSLDSEFDCDEDTVDDDRDGPIDGGPDSIADLDPYVGASDLEDSSRVLEDDEVDDEVHVAQSAAMIARSSVAARDGDVGSESEVALVDVDFTVLSAACTSRAVILGGDGIATNLRKPSGQLGVDSCFERARAPRSAWVTSITALADGALLAATASGAVLRSEDDGSHWRVVAEFAGGAANVSPVHLAASTGDEACRVWARAFGGGLFTTTSGGHTWEGPLLDRAVSAIALDADTGAIVVALTGHRGALATSVDGGASWREKPTPYAQRVSVLALGDQIVACGYDGHDGFVSVDDGQTFTAWPILRDASALCLTRSDDGARHLLFATFDSRTGRSAAGVARIGDGGACLAPEWLSNPHARSVHDTSDDASTQDARIEQIVPIDPVGRQVLFVSAACCVLFTRSGATE